MVAKFILFSGIDCSSHAVVFISGVRWCVCACVCVCVCVCFSELVACSRARSTCLVLHDCLYMVVINTSIATLSDQPQVNESDCLRN